MLVKKVNKFEPDQKLSQKTSGGGRLAIIIERKEFRCKSYENSKLKVIFLTFYSLFNILKFKFYLFKNVNKSVISLFIGKFP